MKKVKTRNRAKIKIRKKVSGSENKPRLAVYRSLNNIYAQLIDDSTGNTLVAVSSLSKDLQKEVNEGKYDDKIKWSELDICLKIRRFFASIGDGIKSTIKEN